MQASRLALSCILAGTPFTLSPDLRNRLSNFPSGPADQITARPPGFKAAQIASMPAFEYNE